jgi:uncharacterized protein
MILYAESSAVLRWLFNEAAGDEVYGHVMDATKVVCSRLTLLECRRAARRALAESRVRQGDADEAMSVLDDVVARWGLLELSREVLHRAEAGFPAEPVRSLDALHLASALVLRQALPSLTMLSTDDRIRRNARSLGFELLPA